MVLSLFLSLIGYGQVGVNMEDKDYINSVTPAPNPAVSFKSATSIVFDNAGNLYVACRYGLVYRVKRGETKATVILDIQEEVAGYGDHGLLGLTLDRDFLNNNRMYIYYVVDMYWYDNFGKPGYDPNRSAEEGATIGRLVRYTLNPGNEHRVDPGSRKILLGETLENGIPIITLSHAGGGLATGADGSILLGSGDASSFIDVDVGCDGTTWYRQAIDRKIIKTIPSEGYGGCGVYDKNKITENIGAYKAQALFSLCGKVLRINPETGDGYPSNPFYKGSGSNLKDPQNLIYALGFRQVFKLSVRPRTGDPNPANGNPGVLYIGDVGFSFWEELDVVTAPGQNFGWPYYEGHARGREGYWRTEVFKPAVHTKPRIQYREERNTEILNGETVTSSNTRPLEGNCIVGGVWHEGGGNYPKEFQDTYYFGDYGSGWIAGARFGHDENPEANGLFKMANKITITPFSERLVGFAFNPYDRNMYYVTLGEKSLVRQIAFTTNQPPTAVITQDKTYGNSPLSINFSARDSFDPEGTPLSYEWNFGDGSSKSTVMNPPTKVFTNGGQRSYNVTLTVKDGQGKSHTTTSVISINNTPPTVQSTSVDGYTQISLPQTINLNATASDAQTPENQLKYQWTVYLYHNDHRHAVSIINGKSGSVNLTEGSCGSDASYWYGMELAVTDNGGLTTTYNKYIYLTCSGQQQTITFDPITDKAPNAPAFRPPVSVSSGLPISLFVVDGPATIENGQVKLTGGMGRVTVRATQHGNGQYKYAEPVERSFMVTNSAPSGPDTQPPSAPTGLTASNITQTSIQLNWNASSDNVGVTGYDVYQNGNKINSNIITATTFAVTGLTPNTTYSFAVVARDAAMNTSGNSNTATAKTLETPTGNQPPVAPTASPLTATVNVAYSMSLPVFTDPNNDPLTYTLTGLPGGLTFNAGNRTITGTPTQQGSFNLTYSANDGSNKTDLTIVLTVETGGGPVVTGSFEGYLDVANCNTISGWAWDADKPNTPITIEFLAATGNNPPLTSATAFGTTLADIYRPDLQTAGKGNGAHGYTLIVPESIKTNQQQTIWGRVQGSTYVLLWSPKTLTCQGTGVPTNQPPVAPTVSALTATLNTAFSQTLPVFTDANNDPLTYSLTGLPSGLSFDAGNRTILGTPTQTGSFNLSYAATDGKSAAVSTTILLTVGSPTPGNQPPVAPTVSALTATLNTAFSQTLPVFTDANNDPLTYSLTGLPSGLSFDAGNRSISGTPTQTGSFNLSYAATDGKSAAVSTTILMTVATGGSTNPAPVPPAISALSATISVAYNNQLPIFTDPNNDPLTYSLTGLPSGLTFNAGNRTITGTPTQSGSFNLTYSASDGTNKTDLPITLTVGTGGGPVVTGSFEGYLDVVNCNTISGWAWDADKPNTPITLEFLAATGSNPPLTSATAFGTTVADIYRTDLQAAGKGNGAHGYTLIVPESIKTNQQQTIWGRVQGSTYVLLWSPKTLTCQGTGVPTNQPPVAPTVSALTATLNTAFSQTLPVFTDANNDPLIYSLTGLPSGLSFDAGNRTILGTPTQTGSFNLSYAATDGKSAPVTTTLMLTVGSPTPGNQPPVAPTVSALTATVNSAFSQTLPVFTDANNDPLTYSLTGLPSGLSFDAGNRTIAGTPTQTGSFNLSYAATDGKSAPVSTTVLLTVGTSGGPVVTGSFEGYLDGVNCTTIS
ncbi:putative Ig domain-containing protein, partial [Larkinella harenae]